MNELDKHITGIYDPNAPFNRNELTEEQIEAKVLETYDSVESIIKALKLTPKDLEDFAHEYADRPYRNMLENDPQLYSYMKYYYFIDLAAKLGYNVK